MPVKPQKKIANTALPVTSFITGSHAYGVPTASSDVDLVVLCSVETCEILQSLAAERGGGKSVRFGRLNVVICTDENDYRAWLNGTNKLVASANEGRKSTKRMAWEVLNEERRKLGVPETVFIESSDQI